MTGPGKRRPKRGGEAPNLVRQLSFAGADCQSASKIDPSLECAPGSGQIGQ